MKRLLSILVVTVIIGLIAYAFLWVKNEEVAQQVSEFNPMRRMIEKSHTGTMTTGAMMDTGHSMMSGAMDATTGATSETGVMKK